MELKTVTIEGTTYAEVQDGKPVYTDNGADVPFDIGGVTALRGEAMRHRQDKEKAEKALKAFEGISDPTAAIAALETVSKIDHKKLIDTGEVDRVKADITKAFEAKLSDAETRASKAEEQLYAEKIGGAFARSKVIADKFAIPADLVQARFGQHFKVEDGKTVAYDANGGRIHGRANPAEPADFEEALEIIVSGYPYKDHILKGTVGAGGGAPPGGGGTTPAKTMNTKDFHALNAKDRAAKMAEPGFRLVD
jgi:hypothetical protein